jgi:transcriptional regulator with XRE-family HTH domain
MLKAKKNKRNPLLSKFAANIRNRRYAIQITQEELAEKSNLHINYIGGIERAERNPSLLSLIAIAKGLECMVSELIP